MTDLRCSARGFTLLELLVSGGLLLGLLALAFRQLPAAAISFESQGEAADMQQRWRAAADALQRDIADAGAGGGLSPVSPALNAWMPPVWPMRLGLRSADPSGTARADTLTLIRALPLPAVMTTTLHPVPARSGSLQVAQEPGCPPLSSVCGLEVGTDVAIADGEGSFDLFTVTAVTPPEVWIRHNQAHSDRVYPPGSRVIPIISRTYSVRQPSSGPPQLVRYDGGTAPDVPVVDQVVQFSVNYLGEGKPPHMRRPLSDPDGPWTTYGPRPPAVDPTTLPGVAGPSCLFASTGSPLATPALPTLGSADGPLVALPLPQLSDGPWCPDAGAGMRYDADIWRIRSLTVTLRVASAIDALRGPAGVLFARPGTAVSGDRYLPDLEMRMRITPLNLSGGR